MKKKKFSIMEAIILTVVIINVAILVIFIVRDKYSYNQIAKQQSSEMLSMKFDHTENYFNEYLNRAANFNKLLSDQISYSEYHLEDDLSSLEEYVRYIVENSINEDSQVSVIGYSDELGRFLGFRINPDNTINLMLKDSRTNDKLVIYSSDNTNSDKIDEFDNYIPQNRPWYPPVKENPTTQWSDIYLNQDELMNLTTTVSTPVFKDNKFFGIVTTDLTINAINEFLKGTSDSNNGLIYIIDEDNKVIANSSKENYIKVSNKESPIYSFLSAEDVDDPVISVSIREIIDKKISGDSFSFSLGGTKYYAYIDEIADESGLGLQAVVVVSEDSLVPGLISQQHQSIASVIIVIIFGLLIKILIIQYIIRPIEGVTTAAKRLSEGDFSVELKVESLYFDETYELVRAFSNMATKLSHAFTTIKENEALLEVKVEEKTRELEETYDELLEKERLASLGGLVAGISHEINTPIGVAVSASSYLNGATDKFYKNLSEGNISRDEFVDYIENVTESLSIIDINLNRAAKLIKSFKQISVNQTSLEKTTFLLKEYLQSIFLALKHEYKKLPVTYKINCDPELEMYNNPGDISQIFTNLIMNSLKHGYIEGQDLTITIDVDEEDDQIIIYFKDDGRGIEKENIKYIFDPFFTSKKNQGGSGLGLNIVYNIVTAKLQGTITCESQLNQGVKYTIKIPK